MYRIKYGKKKAGTFLRTLVFVLFFVMGGVAALLAERMNVVEAEGGEKKDEAVYAEQTLDREVTKEERPEAVDEGKEELSDIREVWISGIDISNYISEGDRIDVRTVGCDGRDEKLLAEKCITGLDSEGVFLLVKEEELSRITEAFIKMEDGRISRAYAVRIP